MKKTELKDDELQEVIEFVEENDFNDASLVPEKIQERGEIIDDTERPNCIVFQVERHREMHPGHRYERRQEGGQEMIAMKTYWPVFSFDPENEEIEKLEERKDPECDINYRKIAQKELRLLSFSIQEKEGGSYVIQCSSLNEKREVESEEEAMEFAEDTVSTMDLSNVLHPDMLIETPGISRESCTEKLNQAAKVEARSEAYHEWNFVVERE